MRDMSFISSPPKSERKKTQYANVMASVEIVLNISCIRGLMSSRSSSFPSLGEGAVVSFQQIVGGGLSPGYITYCSRSSNIVIKVRFSLQEKKLKS